MLSAMILAALLAGEPEPPADAPKAPRVVWHVYQLENCLPCRKAERDFRPWFERAPANDKGEKWLVSNVDWARIRLIDAECDMELAEKNGVTVCPTFILFADNKEVERWVGYRSRELMASRYLEESEKLMKSDAKRNKRSDSASSTNLLYRSKAMAKVIVSEKQVANKTQISYGRLTRIGPWFHGRSDKLCCVCRCTCGQFTVIRKTCLDSATASSCGCYQREVVSQTSRTHGMSSSPEFKSYQKMLERCLSKNSKDYCDYGGRGIRVCERWLDSFENFFADMGYRPSLSHSIDRIEVNGNYEPENCRWATPSEQCNNRRSCRFLEINGVRLTATQWSRQPGSCGSVAAILERLKRGWDAEKCVFHPLRITSQSHMARRLIEEVGRLK